MLRILSQKTFKDILNAILLFFIIVTSFSLNGDSLNKEGTSKKSNILELKNSETHISEFLGKISYLLDSNHNISFKDFVKHETTSGLSHDKTLEKQSFGYSTDRLWIHFKLQNKLEDEFLEFILRYGYAPMNHIELYFIDENNEILKHYTTGRDYPFKERPIGHYQYLFPITLKKDIVYNVYMMFQTKGSLQLPISIVTKTLFEETDRKTYLYVGFYYGFIFLVFLYSIIISISLRDADYLIYSFYILTVALSQLSLHGFGYQLIWPDSISWNRISSVFCMGLTSSSLSIFTIRFLNTRKNSPVMHKLICLNGFVAFIMSFATIWFYGPFLTAFSGYLLSFLFILLVPTSIITLIKGERASGYFLIAILSYLIGVFSYALKDMGLLPCTFMTEFGIVIGSGIELILFSLGLSDRIRQLREKDKEKEIVLQRQKAIAQTTQSLAHDVRKPFTKLQTVLTSLLNCHDAIQIRALAQEYVPLVQDSLVSVNGMIDDVMELGRTAQPKQEPISPEILIELCLNEVCHIYRKSEIIIQYDFNHKYMVNVDQHKFNRVFANIVGNAIQAMDNKGKIWFKTREDMKSGVTIFCIGNSESFIPKASIPKLFDAFFSENKKGGTGLGLAITEKVVHAHGGKIWCESSEENRTVEFFFTIPIAKGFKNKSSVNLPLSTKELFEEFERSCPKNPELQQVNISDPRKPIFEKNILDFYRNNRKIIIGIVDDEPLYSESLKLLFIQDSKLKDAVVFHTFKDSSSFLKSIRKIKFDSLIFDVDLGPNSMNGFSLTRLLTDNGHKTPITIHSNRSSLEDYGTAFKSGASALLPKPMTKAHLLKLVSDSITENRNSKKDSIKRHNRTKNSVVTKAETIPTLDKVVSEIHFIVLEDDKVFATTWKKLLGSNKTKVFTHPEAFWQEHNNNSDILRTVKLIIVDNHFNDYSKTTGVDFARKFKERGFKIPIFLASDGELSDADLSLFHMKVDKMAHAGIKEIHAWLEKTENAATIICDQNSDN